MADVHRPRVVRVRLYAAARAAADGRSEIDVAASTVGDLRAELVERFGARMHQVLMISSLLADGVVVTAGDDAELVEVRQIDVLPPFAGG